MTIAAISDAPNTRISVLRTWLSRPPSSAKDLTLRATAGVDAPDVQLGTWTVSEVVPALAEEIIHALDEHASTVGASVSARLSFLNAAGGEVKVKQLQRGNVAMQPPESLSEVTLDGSPKSQVMQAQAMAQSFAQLMLRSNAVVLQQSVALSAQATEVARSLAEDLATLRGKLRAEQSQVEQLREVLATAPVAESSEGSAALVELLKPHMPIIVQVLGSLLVPKPA